MKKLATIIVALTLLFVASNARAVPSSTSVTYSNSAATNIKKEKGEVLRASATFVVSNLELYITLSNIGSYDPRSPGDILTGIFFDIAGSPTLKPVSATVGTNSTVIGHSLRGFNGEDVGAEWGYNGDLVDAPGGDVYGISATKLKWFNKKDLFPGAKIRGTSPLSGIQFGITTLDDTLKNDDGAIKNKPLIQNTVVFVLDLPATVTSLTSQDITDVRFQYGTSIKTGVDIAGALVTQIPEPNTISLAAAGLLGALALARSSARRR
jgi:hypothetical protein